MNNSRKLVSKNCLLQNDQKYTIYMFQKKMDHSDVATPLLDSSSSDGTPDQQSRTRMTDHQGGVSVQTANVGIRQPSLHGSHRQPSSGESLRQTFSRESQRQTSSHESQKQTAGKHPYLIAIPIPSLLSPNPVSVRMPVLSRVLVMIVAFSLLLTMSSMSMFFVLLSMST